MSIQALAAAAAATSATELITGLRSALGGAEVYAVDHDLRSLRSLGADGQAEIEIATGAIEALAAGQRLELDDRVLLPVLDREHPVLVVSSPDELSDQAVELLPVLGIVLAHHAPFFDLVERRRRHAAMSAAAQLQWDQLPTRAARTGDLRVAAALEPAYEVAGDMFDLAVDGDDALTVVSLDAMGHGVTATLSASLALAAMRTVRRSGGELLDQVRAADRAVADEFGGDRFVTMAAVEFTDAVMRVCNAGHEPIRMSDGERFSRLNVDADPPLGVETDRSYRVHDLDPIAPGEMVCLLSDGAINARDPEGRSFGEERIDEALVRYRSPHPLATAQRFVRAVDDFVDAPIGDDLTVVVVTREDRDVR